MLISVIIRIIVMNILSKGKHKLQGVTPGRVLRDGCSSRGIDIEMGAGQGTHAAGLDEMQLGVVGRSVAKKESIGFLPVVIPILCF